MGLFSGYPPSSGFILGNELAERYSFYGMKTLLTVFFITEHHFTEGHAIIMYHLFTCIAYLSPLIGSVLADSYFGRYKTIFWGSVIYVIGHALLTTGSLPFIAYGIRLTFDLLGLLVIGLATGGIKPCVAAFAVDQFTDDQKDLRSQFFSIFYFTINVGALLALFSTPIFKSRVQCFGSDHCFALAFGVPGVCMLIAFILFVAGTPWYRRLPPARENVYYRVLSCIKDALTRRIRGGVKSTTGDWLDLAYPKHPQSHIRAVRSFLNVALIFSPLPLYQALVDQGGSTWIILSRQLNGRVGPIVFLPEQINVLNPLLILGMIPVLEYAVYPVLRKFVTITPLRKMAAGGFLSAFCYFLLAGLQVLVDADKPVKLGAGKAALSTFGTIDNLQDGIVDLSSLPSGGKFLGGQGVIMASQDVYLEYPYEKAPPGVARIYLLTDDKADNRTEKIFIVNSRRQIEAELRLAHGAFVDVVPRFYSDRILTLTWGGADGEETCKAPPCAREICVDGDIGAVQAVLIRTDGTAQSKQLISGKAYSMAWMTPMYIFISLGEVLVAVNGLEFAYSQAAPSMKTVSQALWLMSIFLGNVIDMIISGSRFVKNQAAEFLLYGVFMVLVMFVFVFIAVRYTYQDYKEDDEKEDEEKNELALEQRAHKE